MSKRRVMIVEDEVMVQMHLAGIVEGLGHQLVGTAEDTPTALELGEKEAPELVLMDIHLAGGGDGVDTALQLAEKLECAIIFITAYADEETIMRTQEIGAGGYLVKPFTDAQVRAAIATAFASHAKLQREREHARSLGGVLTHIGGALFLIDGNNEITFTNQSAADLVGWPVYKVYGRNIFTVLDVDTDDLKDALAKARAGEPIEGLQIRVTDNVKQERAVWVTIESLPVDGKSAPGAVLSLAPVSGEPFTGHSKKTSEDVQWRPFGLGTRLLVYSHDTFGLGHLRRCMAIIRKLCAEFPDISVLLVTGSPMVHRYSMPPGADYVKLPSIQKTGAESYQARSLQIPSPDIQALRTNLILHTARDYQPNVLLVDHSPAGSKGELLPTLDWLRTSGECTCVLGLRDIIDDPATVRQSWSENLTYDVIESYYEHVLVYGSKDMYDSLSEYGLPESVEARVEFVDFISSAESDQRIQPDAPDDKPMIFVTIGGGDGGTETLLFPFLEMMKRFGAELGLRAEIVSGPFADRDLQVELERRAQGLPVVLHEFLPSTRHLLEQAEVTLSTAGYNTCTDILAFAQRSILVPRALYRMEQTIRATQLARLDLCCMIRPDDVTPEALFEAIKKVRRQPGLEEARRKGLPLGGTEKVARFCSNLTVAVRMS
ncbi:MAG: response regulator [bacterium]